LSYQGDILRLGFSHQYHQLFDPGWTKTFRESVFLSLGLEYKPGLPAIGRHAMSTVGHVNIYTKRVRFSTFFRTKTPQGRRGRYRFSFRLVIPVFSAFGIAFAFLQRVLSFLAIAEGASWFVSAGLL
jgi:hypothetical protein